VHKITASATQFANNILLYAYIHVQLHAAPSCASSNKTL